MTELDDLARQWARMVAERPGAAGAFLYGSLAGDRDDRTEFSDIDVALVLEDDALPAHFAEHCLFQAVKTDVTLLPASTLRGWIETPPTGLWAGHWTNGLFLRALTVGGSEIIVVDPHGLIAAARAALPPYETLARPDAAAWLVDYASHCLAAADTALAEGNPALAREKLSPGWLDWTARSLARTKRLPVAAQRLDAPELVDLFARWRALTPPEAEALEASCDAIDALTAHELETFFGPLWGTLRAQGLADPAPHEIHGEWPVFWPGNRVHSLERIAADVAHSRALQRYGRARGELQRARVDLWACQVAETRKRAEGLRDALAAQAFDIAPLAAGFLNDPRTVRLCAAIEAADARYAALPVEEARVREQMQIARQVHTLLQGVVA